MNKTIGFLGIGLLLMMCIYISGCVSFGSGANGTATDTIARMEYGGWIWKTWRLQLTNDHPISDGNGGTDQQRYGVENNATLIQQLQDYQSSGQKVKLYYRGNVYVWDWIYSDPDVVYAVEPVK